jgi:alanyl-tRNA synthetase
MNKVRLLEAEIEVFHGRVSDAMEKYKEALELAKTAELWNEYGLTCERVAKVMQYKGNKVDADKMLLQATDAYFNWGAMAKVDRLRLQLSR